MVKKPSSGAVSRGWRLGKLGLSLTGSYLGYQAQNIFLGGEAKQERGRDFKRRAFREMRDELGSLKGAAMKLGQILSLQTHALPAEAIEELSHLQMHAPAMHPTLARAQFKASVGKYPEEVFAEFDAEPFAAASLGQVHRGLTRKGEKVAVKIQYPAIRSAVENDFKLLRSATLPMRATGHLPGSIIAEIQRGFLEETDYLHEADNLELFQDRLRALAFVSSPKLLREFTTDRVLTMSFVEGVDLGEFLKQRPSAKLRETVGEHLLELYYFQLHSMRALHADHHPGNYLFRPDGSIGLVDFGCVKRITFDASELIRRCVVHAWHRGEKDARRTLALIFGEGVPFARSRKMLPTLEKMAELLYPTSRDKTVDFGNRQMLDVLSGALKQALKDKLTNPEFAFVSRAELGLISLLHRLKARICPADVWKRVDQ